MEIRRVRPHEGDLLRELRVRMVSDSPDAFNDTLERVRSRPQSAWDASAVYFAEASDSIYYIAEDGQQACGTLECTILPSPALSREQVQVTVHAVGGAPLTEDDLQVLGPKLSGALRVNAGTRDVMSTIAALVDTGVEFVDLLRLGILLSGPTEQAGSVAEWDWDGLILPGQTAYLGDMWVAPLSRGKGMGRMLLDTALRWTQRQEARRIILFVTETQTSAIRLYERAGFAPTGHRIFFPPNPRLFIHAMAKQLQSP